MGVELDAITEQQLLDRIALALQRGEGGWVVTPNLDILRQLHGQSEHREMIRGASAVVADGMPLIWASRLQGTPLPERVAGSDLVWSVSALAAELAAPVFLLGGDERVGEQAAARLAGDLSHVHVAGTLAPALGFERDPRAVRDIVDVVAGSGARIVLVGLGFPKQERLIRELRRACPDVWFFGVGISLSFVAGRVRRAPEWIQRLGLEWVHRLIQEPRRLAERYLVHGIPFGVRLLAAAALARPRRA